MSKLLPVSHREASHARAQHFPAVLLSAVAKPHPRIAEHTFTYDAVFNQDIDQERAYEELVKPLLSRVKRGYNVSLVVSGTYTSDKTRLLRGDERQDGIVRKMMKHFFEELESDDDHQKQLITVSNIQLCRAVDLAKGAINRSRQRAVEGAIQPDCLPLFCGYVHASMSLEMEHAVYARGLPREMVKKQRWEKKKERSQWCEEERRRQLEAKGLLESVPEAVSSRSEETPSQTQRGLAQEYSRKKQEVGRIKEELKEQVAEYLKAGSRGADELRTLLSGIRGLRARLRAEEECLQRVKRKLEQVDSTAGLRHESDFILYQATALSHWDLDRLYTAAMKRRSRLAEDNAALVQRELRRMERELELQRAGRSEATVGPDETTRLRREREVVALQLVALRKEKEEAEKDLQTMHRNYRAELGNQKLQALQVLREFREASELQLNALEKRYRPLLQDAIQDAVYLASRKQQLELGNKHLKEVIAELRDQLSVTKQREELPHQQGGETERGRKFASIVTDNLNTEKNVGKYAARLSTSGLFCFPSF
uniref:golgin subfamily A member 6-like protein 9 n=1 Tax=Pristiophorus japonicus TaxID=55135 RepID=UPI00398F0567